MKRSITAFALLALMGLAAVPTQAGELVNNGKFKLNAHGRMQWLVVGQKLDDDFRDEKRLYLFMKQARMRMNGQYNDVRFDVQWAYGGEDLVAAPSPGIALGLLDFSFDVPTPLKTRLKIGQFRVPYGRERLTDSGTLAFGERSIQNMGFAWNRDVGAALYTTRGRFTGTAGVFTGGGRDVPQRYLPEKLGSPMFVVRAGYDDAAPESPYELTDRTDGIPDRVHFALMGNALYIKDSLIGHSTVLNVRTTDKFLLINPNWNPYVARGPMVQGKVWQAGGDAVVRAPLGSMGFTGMVEVNFAKFSNSYGEIAIKGGRAQVGLRKQSVDLNLRYAMLYPDKKMANTYTVVGNLIPQNTLLAPDGKAMKELTPSLTWRYRENVAIVMDMPILMDMIVFQENRFGSYVASQQPDQTSVVKPGAGTVSRQTVVEARLMFQFAF